MTDATHHHPPMSGRALVLGSIGVVYGDIGTSPIYALRESLHAAGGASATRAEVLGIISLLLWTIMLIVSLKYVLLVMRADNKGEGGTLSLVALVMRALARRPNWLLALGVVGISLFFGDAMITPAMSVLSAVEGMRLISPDLARYVLPITLAIIVGLFLVQNKGTGKVSIFFGPIMLVWFVTMAVTGLLHIGDDPGILHAFNPLHAVGYVAANGTGALAVMGLVFLAVTGGEALYADMGHFGRRPIRIAWTAIVLPALALSYLGQGAAVLAHPEMAENPFFLMAPPWALVPLVILATFATVIASQAVISGAFSMVQQAVQTGLLPRLDILHTSETQAGQIYVPRINFILAVGVIVLVLVFQSSSDLASAYGIAVSGDMVITSLLAIILFRKGWRWPLLGVIALMVPILLIEVLFLMANAAKLADGGYIPVLISAVLCVLMWTWVRCTRHVVEKARVGQLKLTSLIEMLDKSHPLTAPGTAVFLTSESEAAPPALLHNLKHNHVLHAQNFIVTVSVADAPYVTDDARIALEPIDGRFSRIRMSFGYMETPNVPKALMLVRREGKSFDIMSTSFFVNRRSFRTGTSHALPSWQKRLYISMTRSASDATDFYRLPSNRTIMLGQQMTL
ncbi:potassium transporter Kup [Falsirhodobacter sp. 20TX0035]|uniref:potassium transporter Kup n=1 Tax=Falsirhodobacter sp. 20TX0035 TaxID=3022019 RepID=UPI00232D9C89|nr:potassium transporter Kup [Falsirhodobacter sp. 20TX0035]MDB6453455.1 potassium transporter Kup [Falsirhodobacter sp. 20TX0035]